jgi:hypothetical protein
MEDGMIWPVGDKLYISIPDVLAWLGLRDTPDNRGAALEAVAAILEEERLEVHHDNAVR